MLIPLFPLAISPQDGMTFRILPILVLECFTLQR